MTPLKQTILETSGDFIIYDEALVSAPSGRLFDPEFWGGNAAPHSEGRGTVWFIDHSGAHWILKTFQRGGLIARLIKRHYFFLGHAHSRMIREYRLLSQMYQIGLPVPRPVAAYSRRTAVFGYSGSLITERLRDVKSLAARLLASETLDDHRWQEIGRTIRKFHDRDVCHSDLNAGNILLDENGVYLIDFDRGRFRSGGSMRDWRQANLDRLKRSVDKLQVDTDFDLAQAWDALVQGYNASLQGEKKN